MFLQQFRPVAVEALDPGLAAIRVAARLIIRSGAHHRCVPRPDP
jgi:hypothetical protein